MSAGPVLFDIQKDELLIFLKKFHQNFAFYKMF
jgi:hypothetical protein